MTQIDHAKPTDLGVKLSGSPKKGHQVELSREGALSAIFGTGEQEQVKALLSHCLKVLKPDEASDDHPANDERMFLLSIIRDIAPRDPIERMLAVQMAATHVATIRAGRWMATSDNLPQVRRTIPASTSSRAPLPPRSRPCESIGRAGNRRVTVQHVNVADGGQAIVGNVQTGGRGCDEK